MGVRFAAAQMGQDQQGLASGGSRRQREPIPAVTTDQTGEMADVPGDGPVTVTVTA